jgi:tetratricopeptide (TPR) repeat protein
MPEQPEQEPVAQHSDSALFARVVELLRRQAASDDPQLLLQRLGQAREELEAFRAAHPDSVPTLRLLAEVSHRLGAMTETREYIRAAELLDPWNLEILIISESFYEEEARSQTRGRGEAPMLDSEISSNSITTEKLVEKAMGSFRLGQLERAYSLAKLAYRIEPDKGHHLLDVWTAGAAFDPERTRRELIELIPEAESQPYLFLALGSVDNVLALHQEAAGWLERGLALDLEQDPYVFAMLLNELAYVMVRTNDRLETAVQYTRRALELFPDPQANGFIRDTLGLAYLKMGKTDKALRNLREAVAKDPTVIPRFHLAIALLTEKNPAEALVELDRIAAARPSLESPHIEEIAILERIQSHYSRLSDLLNLGGSDDIRDALGILEGLA